VLFVCEPHQKGFGFLTYQAMSRITGLLCRTAAKDCAGLNEAMMTASVSAPNWARRAEISGRAAVGWCGWSNPNLVNAGGVLVALDGYIFNREELGEEEPDALLLASLYARYGFDGALGRINGDFAVALYDPALDTLWLGRDRFGLKPLYYAATSDYFGFASRPRPLFNVPGVSRDVNREFVALFAASHYRYFDNRPEKSPYADISQLPASHILRFSNGEVSLSRYWSLEESPDFKEPESELAERYRELLMNAVSLRLKAANHPAFTLSGGMDSSSVLASAVKVSDEKQHAFSTVYKDKTFDESDEIRSMLGQTVKEWHQVEVGTPDVFTLVSRMVRAHDEPVATATWLSHFLLCEEVARQDFGGLFGGLGGDELNAGEYEYFLFHFADLRVAGDEERLAREVEMWVHYHNHPIFRKNFQVVEEGFRRLIDFSRPGQTLADRQRIERYNRALNPDFFDLREFEPVMDVPFTSYLKNRTYQDMMRETAPCCLRAEDRQTAAFSLDNFLPFFDHRLVEFMFRIPGTLKFRQGVTKHLLREAMRGVLPEETRTRVKKTGWNAPAHVWFSGRGRDQVMDLVNSNSFKERNIYNVKEVIRLIDEHQQIVSAGKLVDNHMMFLWQLVNLELWLESL
jgi:asparagine synthase (glutamine-hydrolysing)